MSAAPSNLGAVTATTPDRVSVRADVLALLPDPQSARACLDIAEDAARAIGGRMAAAHVGADPERMIAAPEEIDLQRLRDLGEGSPRARSARVTRAFEDWRTERSGRTDVMLHDCRGDLAGCVSKECDARALVVAPARGNMDARDAFHDVLFKEGKLLLVPPASGYSGELVRHVVIGWKPHTHARGAVVAARRWLLAAERLTVLCVNDRPDGRYQHTAREFLAELGLEGNVVAIGSQRRTVAEAILDFATSTHATCLLTGAYRHGYLVDLLLGRVTHHLLAHAALPLMLSHSRL